MKNKLKVNTSIKKRRLLEKKKIGKLKTDHMKSSTSTIVNKFVYQ